MQNILVLVVEDDPLILMDLEASLQEAGYSTATATSGEAACAKLEKTPDIRALVTDINLHGAKTGWEVARRGRELFPHFPVIYVTSLAAADWTVEGVPKSVLIQKPFAPAQIITAISQLLNATDVPPPPQL